MLRSNRTQAKPRPAFVPVWRAVLSSYREDDIQTNTYRDHWNRVDKA